MIIIRIEAEIKAEAAETEAGAGAEAEKPAYVLRNLRFEKFSDTSVTGCAVRVEEVPGAWGFVSKSAFVFVKWTAST